MSVYRLRYLRNVSICNCIIDKKKKKKKKTTHSNIGRITSVVCTLHLRWL